MQSSSVNIRMLSRLMYLNIITTISKISRIKPCTFSKVNFPVKSIQPPVLKKFTRINLKSATREEIARAIEDRNPDVVFLHKVGPEGTKLDARCYKVIIGAADANFYYFDYP